MFIKIIVNISFCIGYNSSIRNFKIGNCLVMVYLGCV